MEDGFSCFFRPYISANDAQIPAMASAIRETIERGECGTISGSGGEDRGSCDTAWSLILPNVDAHALSDMRADLIKFEDGASINARLHP